MRNKLLLNVALPLRQTFHSCNDSNLFTRFFTTNTILQKIGAGKGTQMVGPMTEKQIMPAEKDPEKLVKYVCGTDFLNDTEPVEIKPDSEYPDWLWTIRCERPPPLDEMDPESKEYWVRTFAHLGRYHKELKKITGYQAYKGF